MPALITHGGYERAIAFCNTKNMTDRLAGLLNMRGISCEAIHGDIQQRVREKTSRSSGRASCGCWPPPMWPPGGWDIDDVDAVFNYDVPDENEYYIHASAVRAGPAATGWLLPGVKHYRGIRLDDIRKNTGNEIRTVKLDAHGELTDVEKQ